MQLPSSFRKSLLIIISLELYLVRQPFTLGFCGRNVLLGWRPGRPKRKQRKEILELCLISLHLNYCCILKEYMKPIV